jgi:hypothetical protein
LELQFRRSTCHLNELWEGNYFNMFLNIQFNIFRS